LPNFLKTPKTASYELRARPMPVSAPPAKQFRACTFRNLNSYTGKFRILHSNFEDLSKFTSRIRRYPGKHPPIGIACVWYLALVLINYGSGLEPQRLTCSSGAMVVIPRFCCGYKFSGPVGPCPKEPTPGPHGELGSNQPASNVT
jgi:hypothetical protein